MGSFFLFSEIKSKSEPFTRYKYLVRIILIWCGRQELNLHGVTHKILSLARLPVPPRPHRNVPYYISTFPVCQLIFPLFSKIFSLFLFFSFYSIFYV